MEITVFAKKRTSNDGKPFTTYISTLTRKDGTKQTVQVKFREECGSPKAEKCPMNIEIEKETSNMATREFTRDNGEAGTSYTLWVSNWKESANKYVDHTMDEFA